MKAPPHIKTLEEIEAEMTVTPPKIATLEEIEAEMSRVAVMEPAQTPANPGYPSQQALLDSMFPELGTDAPPTAPFPGTTRPPIEELARLEALRHRLEGKIASMARYNNLMGSSDKDFITRIQLSQLATRSLRIRLLRSGLFRPQTASRRRNSRTSRSWLWTRCGRCFWQPIWQDGE
jgi:DNA topoisomerase 2-associated protein PAT1